MIHHELIYVKSYDIPEGHTKIHLILLQSTLINLHYPLNYLLILFLNSYWSSCKHCKTSISTDNIYFSSVILYHHRRWYIPCLYCLCAKLINKTHLTPFTCKTRRRGPNFKFTFIVNVNKLSSDSSRILL